MRVTLIYAGIGVAGFNPDRPAGDREGSWISHGTASIGACLKKEGHKVDLIDMRHCNGWEGVGEEIKNAESDVYMLSVSAVDYYIALYTAVLIKQHHPNSKVVVGGIHPTLFPDLYAGRNIDTVVIGEGEVSVPRLLKMEVWPKQVQGEAPDLNSIPWIDRELFDYHKEMGCVFAPDQKTPSITMLAGRGCPYRCTYCQPAENAVFGKPHRMRTPKNVVDELVFLKYKYKFNSITFWDDTFTVDKRWVREFCDLYEKHNFRSTIAACSRVDLVCSNEDMVKRLASIGVDWLVLGLESGSQRLLDFIKKGTTVEQNIQAAEICRKYGIKIFGTYMYGLPTETKEESRATADMIKKISPEHASPFFFRPIPGTDIHTYCKENKLILNDSVARTGEYAPSIRGVDYDYIKSIM